MRRGALLAATALVSFTPACSADRPWVPTNICGSVDGARWRPLNVLNRATLTQTSTTIPDVDLTAVWVCSTASGGCVNAVEVADYPPLAFRWTGPGRLTVITSGAHVRQRRLDPVNAPDIQLVRVAETDFARRAEPVLGAPLSAADVVYSRSVHPCRLAEQWGAARSD